MKIGVPAEISDKELRVAVTSKTVKRLIKQGFSVYIQKDAGIKANFSNAAFEEAGATIVQSAKDIYGNTDIVLKVKEPSFEEISLMKKGLLLICHLWPGQNPELIKKLAEHNINAIAMDAMPRITRAQNMDVLSSMANIAGYRAVVDASFYFGRFLNGQITAAGKIEPAKVLVIGAGVAGLAAIGTAKSLGAIVRAFDTRKEVAEQIKSMGAEPLSVDIEEEGSTASGYSQVMSDEFIEAEMQLFKKQASECDIIITTAQIPGKQAPKLLLDYHVEAMKPGSVIVDLAASTGGNCVMTKKDEIIVTDNGVTILGKVNQMPEQASQLYSTNLCNLLDYMGKAENWKIDINDEIISRIMVAYNGKVNWPPKPLPVSTQQAKAKEVKIEKKVSETISENKTQKRTFGFLVKLLIMGAVLFIVGQFTDRDFMQHFTIFVFAVFIGWNVIWNVTHSLHTPLMSVTNAISGIIVIGGLLQIKGDFSDPVTILAFIAILVASINIVGGFFVTYRMLKMFKK